MKKLFLVVAIAFLGLFYTTQSQAQQILQAIITPFTPGECDSVTLIVQGQLPSGTGVTSVTTSSNLGVVNVEIVYGSGGGIGFPFLMEVIELGVFSAGNYDVFIRLTDGSWSTTNHNTAFTVTPSPCCALQTAFTLSTDTVCIGGTVQFNSQTQGATSLQWFVGQQLIGSSANASFQFNATGQFTVSLVAESGSCFDTLSKQVTVVSGPSVSLSAADTVLFCSGDSILLQVPAGFAGYSWKKNGVPVLTGSNQFSATSQGFYEVTVSAGGSCETTTGVYLSFYPSNPPTITQNGGLLICSQALSYQWLKDNQVISGATGSVYEPEGPGYYAVVVTGANGCKDTSEVLLFLTSVPESGQEKPVLFAYPNPAKALVFIETSQAGPFHLILTDLTGREILSMPFSGSERNLLDVSRLSQGAYFLVFENHLGRISSQKILVK